VVEKNESIKTNKRKKAKTETETQTNNHNGEKAVLPKIDILILMSS
jgi:hypothetical protein